jgi:hypothetical protein
LAAAWLAAVPPAAGQDESSAGAATAEKVDHDDYIRTTAGVVFRGKITQEDGDKVTIQTRSGPVTVPRSVIDVLRKGDVDYRPASQRIRAVEIPEGQEAAFLLEATKAFREGGYEKTIGVCKALMEAKHTSKLSDEQRDATGRIAAGAYFELEDWPAASDGLSYAARAVASEVDRRRIQAMAEALASNEPPNIGGQTVENFSQAMSAAMRWKGDRIFEQTREYVESQRDMEREDGVKRTLRIADERLGQTETFVPGYSIERWPEVCRAMVTKMIAGIERATAQCEEDRSNMIRYYWQKVLPTKAAAWNEKCVEYLSRRQAAEDCLANVEYVEANHPLKNAYKDDEYKALAAQRDKLAKQLEDLKYYNEDATGYRNKKIKLKGKRIVPSSTSR